MKYAILGDIHGNWEALSVVLADAREQGVTAYVSVGDIVGYNAAPVQCIDAVRELDCLCVRGNHDHFCMSPFGLHDLSQIAAAGVMWTRGQLDEERRQYLGELERQAVVEGFTLVHNSLDNSTDWKYVVTVSDAEAHFGLQTTRVCFHGHTHVPVVFEKRNCVTVRYFRGVGSIPGSTTSVASTKLKLDFDVQYFINVGSVGQPRDRDPRAAYLIYDMQTELIELRRLPYDIRAARGRISEAKLPQWLGLRLGIGR